jgi:hypothetical protein
MLLARRYRESGNFKQAPELYDRVMTSRDVAKRFKLAAAMQAGRLHARLNNDAAQARQYWQLIERDFREFKFFASQASFLLGNLDENSFGKLMGDSPEGQATAEYIIGLHHRLNGNRPSAIRAYQRCLQIDTGESSLGGDTPRAWAREDLRRLMEKGPD